VQDIELQGRLRQLAGLQNKIDGLACCLAPDFTHQFNKVPLLSVYFTLRRLSYCIYCKYVIKNPVFQVRIDLKTDPDTAIYVDTDPDLDSYPVFFMKVIR